MEDTTTISSQKFWLNKYGILTVSLASAFSVNAMPKESADFFTADSGISIQMEMKYTETLCTDKTYTFSTKKNFRERYKRIAQSEWFKKTHSGMSIVEIMTIEE